MKYFTIDEFKCKCGKCKLPSNTPPKELIEVLTEIREHFGKPMIIRSGYRCKNHNAKVGGSPNSRHIKGDAVDFIIQGIRTEFVYDYVINTYGNRPYGIAKKININNHFQGFVHLDTRGKKARWEYK